MKKGIALAMVVGLSSLILISCGGDDAPVGASVRLVDADGKQIAMRIPTPFSAVGATFEPDFECEVVSGPETADDVTYWELSCSGGFSPALEAETFMVGWVDVTQIEVID